jgi:hypothetical protein
MQATPSDSAEIVRSFIRGDRPWQDLRLIGLSVSFMDDGCDCEGKGDVLVTPTIADIARGFLHHASAREVDLRRWASIILAASAVIDLAALEEHPDGETVLDALWEASAGSEMHEWTLNLLRDLVRHS